MLKTLLLEWFRRIDWIILGSAILMTAGGMTTMYSFRGDEILFQRQLLYLCIAVTSCLVLVMFDFRFLRHTGVVVTIFIFGITLLAGLFFLGHVSKGAQSWFRIGGFSFQPSDPIKIILIILLAKYFSRRHIEIRNIRHIIVSGLYSCLVCLLVLVQPDFGSAVIIFLLWFGMVLVSGISYKHIALVVGIGVVTFAGLWGFAFKDYQKARIMTFIHPLADVRGAGYNAYQSMIAVGSGEVIGKGVGYGTQSRLKFLPEYQTDFIFAAFSEEWGLIGSCFFFILYATLIIRILMIAVRGQSNFEVLYGLGLAQLFFIHFIVNVGMNIGLLPVTGVALPFMSYGGSHLLTEYSALGILMAMKSYARPAHKEVGTQEIELLR